GADRRAAAGRRGQPPGDLAVRRARGGGPGSGSPGGVTARPVPRGSALSRAGPAHRARDTDPPRPRLIIVSPASGGSPPLRRTPAASAVPSASRAPPGGTGQFPIFRADAPLDMAT